MVVKVGRAFGTGLLPHGMLVESGRPVLCSHLCRVCGWGGARAGGGGGGAGGADGVLRAGLFGVRSPRRWPSSRGSLQPAQVPGRPALSRTAVSNAFCRSHPLRTQLCTQEQHRTRAHASAVGAWSRVPVAAHSRSAHSGATPPPAQCLRAQASGLSVRAAGGSSPPGAAGRWWRLGRWPGRGCAAWRRGRSES